MSPWIVTTRHLDSRHPEGRYPWGTRHVRHPEGGATACGLDTSGWRLFWHLPFDIHSPDTCQDCSTAIAPLTGGLAPRAIRAR